MRCACGLPHTHMNTPHLEGVIVIHTVTVIAAAAHERGERS